MSYFQAKNIRYNKTNGTFQAFGDDNNVFPKHNKWTNDIPLVALLSEIGSGNIQFTTATEKNLRLRALVKEYEEKLRLASEIPDDVRNDYSACYILNSTIERYRLPNMTSETLRERAAELRAEEMNSYVERCIKEVEFCAALLEDPVRLARIDNVVREFILTATQPTPNLKRFVLRNTRFQFVYNIKRRQCSLTEDSKAARKLTYYIAQYHAERFGLTVEMI